MLKIEQIGMYRLRRVALMYARIMPFRCKAGSEGFCIRP